MPITPTSLDRVRALGREPAFYEVPGFGRALAEAGEVVAESQAPMARPGPMTFEERLSLFFEPLISVSRVPAVGIRGSIESFTGAESPVLEEMGIPAGRDLPIASALIGPVLADFIATVKKEGKASALDWIKLVAIVPPAAIAEVFADIPSILAGGLKAVQGLKLTRGIPAVKVAEKALKEALTLAQRAPSPLPPPSALEALRRPVGEVQTFFSPPPISALAKSTAIPTGPRAFLPGSRVIPRSPETLIPPAPKAPAPPSLPPRKIPKTPGDLRDMLVGVRARLGAKALTKAELKGMKQEKLANEISRLGGRGEDLAIIRSGRAVSAKRITRKEGRLRKGKKLSLEQKRGIESKAIKEQFFQFLDRSRVLAKLPKKPSLPPPTPRAPEAPGPPTKPPPTTPAPARAAESRAVETLLMLELAKLQKAGRISIKEFDRIGQQILRGEISSLSQVPRRAELPSADVSPLGVTTTPSPTVRGIPKASQRLSPKPRLTSFKRRVFGDDKKGRARYARELAEKKLQFGDVFREGVTRKGRLYFDLDPKKAPPLKELVKTPITGQQEVIPPTHGETRALSVKKTVERSLKRKDPENFGLNREPPDKLGDQSWEQMTAKFEGEVAADLAVKEVDLASGKAKIADPKLFELGDAKPSWVGPALARQLFWISQNPGVVKRGGHLVYKLLEKARVNLQTAFVAELRIIEGGFNKLLKGGLKSLNEGPWARLNGVHEGTYNNLRVYLWMLMDEKGAGRAILNRSAIAQKEIAAMLGLNPKLHPWMRSNHDRLYRLLIERYGEDFIPGYYQRQTLKKPRHIKEALARIKQAAPDVPEADVIADFGKADLEAWTGVGGIRSKPSAIPPAGRPRADLPQFIYDPDYVRSTHRYLRSGLRHVLMNPAVDASVDWLGKVKGLIPETAHESYRLTIRDLMGEEGRLFKASVEDVLGPLREKVDTMLGVKVDMDDSSLRELLGGFRNLGYASTLGYRPKSLLMQLFDHRIVADFSGYTWWWKGVDVTRRMKKGSHEWKVSNQAIADLAGLEDLKLTAAPGEGWTDKVARNSLKLFSAFDAFLRRTAFFSLYTKVHKFTDDLGTGAINLAQFRKNIRLSKFPPGIRSEAEELIARGGREAFEELAQLLGKFTADSTQAVYSPLPTVQLLTDLLSSLLQSF